MRSIRTLGNSSGSAEKRYDPKMCDLAVFYINLCAIHFYDEFAEYRNLVKTIASGNMVVESLQLKALAESLGPALYF